MSELAVTNYPGRVVLTDPQPDVPSWTFLTNHAHVLIAIGRDPELRQRDIAHAVGITVGAVQKIVGELEREGYLTSERFGRRNRYTVNPDLALRHPLEGGHTIGELLATLTDEQL
jgi:hypothetical protein